MVNAARLCRGRKVADNKISITSYKFQEVLACSLSCHQGWKGKPSQAKSVSGLLTNNFKIKPWVFFCFKFDSEWARWRLWHKNLSYLIIKFFVPSSSHGVVSIISLSSSSTSSSSSSCRSKEVSYVCCQKLSFAKKLSQLNFSAKTTFCRKSISLFVFHASLWKQKLTLLDQFSRLLCLAQRPPYLHRTVLL